MEQYRLFFSWQNDRKDTKKVIKAALKKAKTIFFEDGIELFVDEDTRERVGKRNIDAEWPLRKKRLEMEGVQSRNRAKALENVAIEWRKL